jgi:hypothetical protein
MSEFVDRATTEIVAEGCLPQSVSHHASARGMTKRQDGGRLITARARPVTS